MHLKDTLKAALQTAKFTLVPTTSLDTRSVRQLIHQTPAEDQLRSLRLLFPEASNHAPVLERVLSTLLDPFRDPKTGKIGYLLTKVMSGIIDPTVKQFAQSAITAAAVFGSDRVADTIMQWVQGEPVDYVEVCTLRGIRLETPMDMGNGVRFENITSKTDLQAIDPLSGVPKLEFGGPAMLIGRQLSRVFYLPPDPDLEAHVLAEDQPFSSPQEFDNLINALSLACNSCVSNIHSWRRHSEMVRMLNPGGMGASWSSRNEPPFFHKSGTLSPKALDTARLLLPKLRRHSHLAVPVARWKSSMKDSSPHEQLIDLRILLEALYTRGVTTELGFRVALFGAWHLGERRYFDLFKQVYRNASKVIHANQLKGGWEANRALVESAQQACRAAILKRLDEPKNLDFCSQMLDDLLGSEA